MSSASASRNVIGTISSTVVRLSRNADNTAVVTASDHTTATGRPFESWPALIASHVYTPVGSVTLTISIIPASSPSVFQSIASIACVLVDRLREQHQHAAPRARPWCDRRARSRSRPARRRRGRLRGPQSGAHGAQGVDQGGHGRLRSPTRLPGTPRTTIRHAGVRRRLVNRGTAVQRDYASRSRATGPSSASLSGSWYASRRSQPHALHSLVARAAPARHTVGTGSPSAALGEGDLAGFASCHLAGRRSIAATRRRQPWLVADVGHTRSRT